MLRWPDAATVRRSVERWAAAAAARRADVLRIGYFGSYARGDWGVGSDVDLLVVVERDEQPFVRRAAAWDATDLPVPADVFVYTVDEWRALSQRERFHQTLLREAVWVYERGASQA